MKIQNIIITLLLIVNSLFAQDQKGINVIPLPGKVEMKEGFFELNAETEIIADKTLLESVKQLIRYLELPTGIHPEVNQPTNKSKNQKMNWEPKVNLIRLQLQEDLKYLGEEGYILEITREYITLTAFNPKGIFYGIQTLRQLMPEQIFREVSVRNINWYIPCVRIEDKPRFKFH